MDGDDNGLANGDIDREVGVADEMDGDDNGDDGHANGDIDGDDFKDFILWLFIWWTGVPRFFTTIK